MRKLHDLDQLHIPRWVQAGRRRRTRSRWRVLGMIGGVVLCSVVIGILGGRGVGAYAASAAAVLLLAVSFASGV